MIYAMAAKLYKGLRKIDSRNLQILFRGMYIDVRLQ